MPTALTSSTAREDLLEVTIQLACLVVQEPISDRRKVAAVQNRTAVLTARYLNTLKVSEAAEEEHDELEAAAIALLRAGVHLGVLVPNSAAQGGAGPVYQATRALVPLAARYLDVMQKRYEL